MKKVGIVTLCGNNNFGNKLQNYALKTTIEKYGCNVETIWIERAIKTNKIRTLMKYTKRLWKDYLWHRKRRIHFIKFNKYLNISKKHIYFEEDMKKIVDNYDSFFVGSDQVWNCNYLDAFNIYFLKDIPKNKANAYAGSFGIESIPDKFKDIYIDGINHLNKISVREEQGKNIVEDLTERKDCEVVLDPTLLLTSDEWQKIEKKPKNFNSKKYILLYFLGSLSEDKYNYILEYAEKNNCEIINILDKKCKYYNCGPCEFLYLERNAHLIFTDSFHSSVFSIIFKRPFIVFEKSENGYNTFSRLESLLSKFKLDDRKFDKDKEIELNIDYEETYKILKKEQEKANKFIKDILNNL